jgi:hypothetical protein
MTPDWKIIATQSKESSGPATERPLSFAADMVRAVQAGRKTQTRRAMYPQPGFVEDGRFFRADGREIICPFGLPGDLLWVRERFAVLENGQVVYAADPVKRRSKLQWEQSRDLPREHSRLLLRVISTRAQQLQDINEADALAEGYDRERETLSPIDWFARLWDRLQVVESMRWQANPWMWVVHFEVVTADVAAVGEQRVEKLTKTPALPPPPQVEATTPTVSKTPTRQPRTATIEEKQRLAQLLRVQIKSPN